MKRRNILITGGSGFIFSNFIRQIFHTKQPYNVASLDRVKDFRTIYINPNHSFHIADVRDAHILDVIFKKEEPEIVVHGAAESHVDNSIEDANPFMTSNVVGTQNVIDACLKYNVKRMIYCSTDEIAGQLKEGEIAWTEEAPLNPRNPYAASKASGELLVKAAHNTHGLNYQIIRSCNNYGPWQSSDKFIPKIIRSVLNNEEMPIYGRGLQSREWIHVFDFCSALFKIINEGEENQIYNISARQEFSNIEVFQIVCNALGQGHDLLKFVEDRKGHDFRYAVDNTKLKELGWEYKFKFKDGIKQTVEWYKNNKFFLKD